MRVAVAGGTGLVGGYVVQELTAAGHEPVVLARSRGVDLVTGAGLDAAMAGVEAVVDVSNLDTTRARTAIAFFESAGRHLLDAGARVGVRHHVVLSIVGLERVGLGYYQGKLRQEEIVVKGEAGGTAEGGAVPWTVLRATQFHEFPLQVLDQVPGPLAVVPRMRTQPVAAREVARHLVELVLGPPRGMAPELAGPQVEELVDMTRRLLRARGQRRLLLPVKMPGRAGTAMVEGGNLPTGSAGPRGSQTFDEWLAEHVGQGEREVRGE
ncbi:3-beta hydroxysteroid dehydrogenase [Streptomyces dioscori]|uniref:3-beta hydroxysteroid dehydrogenase n=1 Tax=Streptomyces dioscori TaxID=2109333 RepID=A0A2P8QCJ2_9ACTN|nr:3-beta hydroxysteroid dehydrogenase [Streptomyces dioscori]PSM43972.1 3-beta hydroxysteroid dehydrogenase [Streptomyces dioscori]